MASNAATVIDLAKYRKSRSSASTEQSHPVPTVVAVPVVLVCWWSMVPVYMVPGYI